MFATTTTQIEHIAYRGPIGISAAIAFGVLLLAVFAWSLWRERRILGKRPTVLFWTLRAIALSVVIWMLLAPARVREQVSTTRRAVAIVTDISASMNTVDPPGTADDLRWAVAFADEDRFRTTQAADRAIAALGMARQHLQAAEEAIRRHAPEGEIVENTTATDDALSRMREHLRLVGETANPAGSARSLATRLTNAVVGAEFEAFTRLSNALEKGRNPSEKGWRESLPDLDHRLASLSSSLHELARHAAEEETTRIAREAPELLTGVRKESRLSHAAELIGRLEKTLFGEIRDLADIHLSACEQQVHPLESTSSPDSALRAMAARQLNEQTAVVGTNLASVIDQVNRDRQQQPVAAVILLTDVAHNATDIDLRAAAATLPETPIYVVPLGNTQHVRDAVLHSVFAPSVAMRNDDVVIEARVRAYDCAGEVCTVQLLQDGDVVDFREVVLDSGFVSRGVRFEQRMPTVGNQKFQIALVPLDGELTEDNNFGEVEINVTRSDIKLLLADELPRWEYRYLAQLFRRDPKVELDELLFHPRMVATGRREATQTFPITVDEWDQYDVVILGDVPPEHFPVAAQESLATYLQQRGGTLVLIAGSEAMPHQYADHPLRDILPVQPIDSAAMTANRYTFRVTEEGENHLALMIAETEEATRTAWEFVNRYSPLPAVSDWRQPGPLARTLIAAVPENSVDEAADAKSSAFLCWQPVGRGRVVYLSAPDTYRLRYLRGDRLHYRFWGQLLRWAVAADLSSGTKFVRIRTDRSRYDSRSEVHVTVRLTDSEGEPLPGEGLSVRLTNGTSERLALLEASADVPGEFHATLRELSPGVYRVEPQGTLVDELQQAGTQDAASASFTVQAEIPTELIDTRCDRALAQQLADITGGQVIPPTAIEEILRMTNLEPIVQPVRTETELWIRWKYLWIVFGCLQTEWIVRKWKGLS